MEKMLNGQNSACPGPPLTAIACFLKKIPKTWLHQATNVRAYIMFEAIEAPDKYFRIIPTATTSLFYGTSKTKITTESGCQDAKSKGVDSC